MSERNRSSQQKSKDATTKPNKPSRAYKMDLGSSTPQLKPTIQYDKYLETPDKRKHIFKNYAKQRRRKKLLHVLIIAFILALIIIGIKLLNY